MRDNIFLLILNIFLLILIRTSSFTNLNPKPFNSFKPFLSGLTPPSVCISPSMYIPLYFPCARTTLGYSGPLVLLFPYDSPLLRFPQTFHHSRLFIRSISPLLPTRYAPKQLIPITWIPSLTLHIANFFQTRSPKYGVFLLSQLPEQCHLQTIGYLLTSLVVKYSFYNSPIQLLHISIHVDFKQP